MRLFLYSIIILFSCPAFSYSPKELFFDPHLAVGVNPAQGTHFMAGLDVGYAWDPHLAFGMGGYYSAGEQAKHDREIGGGPFVSYTQPITGFLIGNLRQEINYVDLYSPIKTVTPTGTTYSHTREMGVASVSRAGLHIFFTPNFGLSVGYRLVIGLTNSKLDDGRSGVFAGFSIGI